MVLAEEDAFVAERLGALPDAQVFVEMRRRGRRRNLDRLAPLPRRVEDPEGPGFDHALTAHAGALARRSMASSRIWQPAASSSGLASSISLWLMPSAQGT